MSKTILTLDDSAGYQVTEITASPIEGTPRVGRRRDDFVIIPDIERLFS